MALQQIKFAPGIDRQDTSVGAVGRWTDSDLTRFRYGSTRKSWWLAISSYRYNCRCSKKRVCICRSRWK